MYKPIRYNIGLFGRLHIGVVRLILINLLPKSLPMPGPAAVYPVFCAF